ncbi:MAG: hypothetical protein M5U19_11450 [Microthrixaceae bacterium]|nr:hypothetical protein [Microthrixaceae bacterium]
MLRDNPLAPPVVRLKALLGWSPLPLSVRDARRSLPPLRDLAALPTPTVPDAPQASPGIKLSGRSRQGGSSCATDRRGRSWLCVMWMWTCLLER